MLGAVICLVSAVTCLVLAVVTAARDDAALAIVFAVGTVSWALYSLVIFRVAARRRALREAGDSADTAS